MYNPSTTLLLVHFLTQGFQLLVNQGVARRHYDYTLYNFTVAGVTSLFLAPFLFLWAHGDTVARTEVVHQLDSWGLLVLVFLLLGGSYSLTTYSRLRAQNLLPSYVFAPLSRVSLLVVVVVSVAYMGEKRSWLELLAIGVTFIPLIVVRSNDGGSRQSELYREGLTWTLLSVLCATGLQLASKISVDPRFGFQIPVLLYVCGVSAGNMIVSTSIRLMEGRSYHDWRPSVLWGTLGGILNLGSFLSLTLYLVNGDASTIYPVSSLSLIVPVVVLRVLGKEERPTLAQVIALLLSLGAIYILMS